MDGDAGAHLAADAIAAARDAARLPTPSDDEECDDLYGDVNVGFLPLLPLSPSPSPTSPPKTPSPGHSPSPPPHSVPSPEPQPPPKPATSSGHQPPRPAPAPRHHMPPPPPQRAPRVDASSLPPSAAVYISELHWWTTDAEVEAALALAPHAAAALLDLYFYADKYTGKSRGVCRADFLHRSAAASAAAALHGRAFHGRHCVASLSRPPALHRLGDDSDSSTEAPAQAPNPARGRGDGGRGRGASDATVVRANVGPVLGDRPAQAPLPPRSMAPRPRGPPFGGVMGSGGGYGVLQSMGQFNAGMGTAMMPSVVAAHVNTAFLAAGGMAMGGPGMWHDQGMAGGLWGAQQPCNFRCYQMPWQQLTPPAQRHQAQQQYGNYGKGRSMMRERLGRRSEERGIGNVRRQSDRDGGGDRYKEHDREDQRDRHRERVLEKERGREERYWDERDVHGSGKRRNQEYTDRDDFDRRGRARSRSQSRDGDDDDHPRRQR